MIDVTDTMNVTDMTDMINAMDVTNVINATDVTNPISATEAEAQPLNGEPEKSSGAWPGTFTHPPTIEVASALEDIKIILKPP